MKRIVSFLVAAALFLSLCACQGNFGKVDLQDTVAVPEDGVIKEELVSRLREENAIGCFRGVSNGYTYEWTIFGSDVMQTGDINLQTQISKSDGGITVSFSQTEAFGFPTLLSVTLDELWPAQTATAYRGGQAVASVSLTGTKQTILNLSVNDILGTLTILPDELPAEMTQQPDSTAPEVSDALTTPQTQQDDYLSASGSSSQQVYTAQSGAQGSGSSSESDRVYSDGTATEQDQYLTDPVPAGKPMPVEPEDQNVNQTKTYTCTFSIECSTILNNLDDLDPDKLEMVPSGGTILSRTTVTFYEGESVFDVLQRLCRDEGIHMESSWTPIYNSAYIEGIHNLYEFDCGSLSGWMYRVNGWYPNYGCSRYVLQQGDVVEWRYTCDLGNDIGGGYAVGGQNAG